MLNLGIYWLHRVGSFMLLLMTLLTTADVMLRYFFNRPIPGAYELVQFMMVILVSFSLAYCFIQKGHISVDVVISRCPQRAQVIIKSIGTLISLGLVSLITWQSALYAKVISEAGWESLILDIPLFPFIAVVSCGCGVLCLALLKDFVSLCRHSPTSTKGSDCY